MNDRYGRYNRRDEGGTGYDSGRDYGSSARDYAAAGWRGEDRDRWRSQDDDRSDYGRSYGQRSGYGAGGGNWERDRDERDSGYGARSYGGFGGYAAGGYGRSGGYDRDRGQERYQSQDRQRSYGRDYGPQRSGYDRSRDDDRGFFDRAGDEIRSWFGDEEAERRREADQRYDARSGRNERWTAGSESDDHYQSWRRQRIAELDRDYDEYRRENSQRFESEFGSWRTDRQGQRDQLSRVNEHMDVVGSDGTHVGTVDKVRGDRVILTKNDAEAGGRHHSIPSRWIQSVDERVTLRKTADEAKKHWKDEERSGAFFNQDDDATGRSNLGATTRSYTGNY